MESDTDHSRALFFEIAHCKIAVDILDDKLCSHRCDTIVRYQSGPPANFQLPEPWIGHIGIAPLLFISSNPSIGDDEHAVRASSQDEIWNCHVRLFDPEMNYTQNAIYATSVEGRVRKHYVRHWAFVRSRARELLQRMPVAGIDYALTEIAHCKTRDEIGVRQCAAFCADRYLRRILGIAGAHLVIAMGFYAHREVRRLFGVRADRNYAKVSHERCVIFVPHSNYRGKRTLNTVIPEHLSELREFLGTFPVPVLPAS
jgi:hypothetical protein